ncbi:Protein bir1 [Cladobotryum mycophilum]|uniref:Protein bir1 n=1 Tax=Cladobotryum mycophilum TaxID=491253 RepID=A0ABR0S703_9HYPO
MAAADTDQYFTYEARLNSFQKTTKKRGSTAGGRATKALNWPHKQISPASLARAGFFFRPSPESPDNTVCFLCEKGLDGWEAGDDPLVEHVKHAPHCGWAVVAAIEADVGDYGKEDPNQYDMIEARKATFGERWPHDNKKGWKCKTKQLVEAGWNDEHYNRSPSCPFFVLGEQYKGATKSNGRSKTLSSSKASRLSVQSIGTVVSETTALTDQSVGLEDSVLTTASTMTQQGTKKPRAKKGAAAKGTKKKVKKEEPSEIHEGSPPIEDGVVSQPKSRRGKKRGSEAVEDTVDNSSVADDTDMTDAASSKTSGRMKAQSSSKLKPAQLTPEPLASPSNASVASLRAPPGSFPDDDEIERQLEADLERQSSDVEISHDSDSERRSKAKIKEALVERVPEKEPTPPASETSAAYAMFNPNAPEPDEATIDDELKALQAEMEVAEPEPEPQAPKKAQRASIRNSKQTTKGNKSIIELPPPEKEVDSIEVGMQPEEEAHGQEQEQDHDMTVGSTDTVLKKVRRSGAGKQGQERPSTVSFLSVASIDEIEEETELAEAAEVAELPAKRGRGRPSKASLASQVSNNGEDIKPAEAPAKRGRGRPSKTSLASQGLEGEESRLSLVPAKKGRGRPPKSSFTSQDGDSINVAGDASDLDPPTKRGRGRPSKKSMEPKTMEEIEVVLEEDEKADEPEPIEDVQEHGAKSPTPPPASQSLGIPPSTPIKAISPAPSGRQPVLSPSQSPQSSDAENQPPSSRPAAPPTTKKVVLAPVTATPMRGSPSKRNVFAGLQSTTPWTGANLDTIFGTPRPGGEKETGVERFLKQGRDLTSSEQRMTVEEWIYFNANEAENKLKHECETLVSRFESEGTRAINVLEGLEVE